MEEVNWVSYVLTALAAGAVAYTFRYWGKWREFARLWVAIVAGAALGLLVDGWPEGFRTGIALGGLGLPVVDAARAKVRKKGQE